MRRLDNCCKHITVFKFSYLAAEKQLLLISEERDVPYHMYDLGSRGVTYFKARGYVCAYHIDRSAFERQCDISSIYKLIQTIFMIAYI